MPLLSPVNLMFLSLVLMGPLFALSSSNWLIIYVGLELNMIGFIPLVFMTDTKFNYKQQSATKAGVTYFCSQVAGSTLLLLAGTMIYMKTTFFLTPKTWLLMGLLLKLGVAPFHLWFPPVMINTSHWLTCFLLCTWQKLAPLALSMTLFSPQDSVLFIFPILMSCWSGAFCGIGQTAFRTLAAFSSIGHTPWILATGLISIDLAWFYFIIYSATTAGLMFLFHHLNLNTPTDLNRVRHNTLLYKTSLVIHFLSLSGMPPFLGFAAKLLSVEALISCHPLLVLGMLLLNAYSIFFYINFSVAIMTTPSTTPILFPTFSVRFPAATFIMTLTVLMNLFLSVFILTL